MIEYELTLDDGTVERFRIDPDRPTARAEPGTAPAWAALERHQCTNCPLRTEEHPHCPVALDVREIAERFAELISFQRARLRVITSSREYTTECSVETGLASLLGVVMASSGCPHFDHLRPLTRFHLPFYTVEETLLRTVGLYLIRQVFEKRRGEEPDFDLDGLRTLYDELQIVNRYFKKRLSSASKHDANLNAIASLFALSSLVAVSLDEGLEDLQRALGPMT